MRAVIQRVSQASVNIDKKKVASINEGLLILLGIEIEDTKEDADWLANKISTLRIFSDSEGKMNKSVTEVDGEVIVVSQFTLHDKKQKRKQTIIYKSCQTRTSYPFVRTV